jgi:Domain of unknown function (DUF4111)
MRYPLVCDCPLWADGVLCDRGCAKPTGTAMPAITASDSHYHVLMGVPYSIPADVASLLSGIVVALRVGLGSNLVGIYLHGSLALGCFNPQVSDIDFLAVVHEPLGLNTKRNIVASLLKLSEAAPRKGLEMSIVMASQARHVTYPPPFELHFSPTWFRRYQGGRASLDAVTGDPDLAAHFVTTRARGIVLWGKPIAQVFGDVPDEYYIASILEDARDVLADMTSHPVYNVLNLCRVLAFLKQHKITSKLEAGEWALEHLNDQYGSIIEQAVEEYTGQRTEPWDENRLRAFGRYFEHELH